MKKIGVLFEQMNGLKINKKIKLTYKDGRKFIVERVE